MKKSVKPSPVSGEVKAPPSKSYSQRAIIAASLANGISRIFNYSKCDDSQTAINIGKSFGADISVQQDFLEITGYSNKKNNFINCGESAFCTRVTAALGAIIFDDFQINGSNSLLKRSFDDIENILSLFSLQIESDKRKLPFRLKGKLKSGIYNIDFGASSQLLSGLLFALPLCQGDSIIEVKSLKSKPYVDLTIQTLKEFGVFIDNKNNNEFSINGNQKYNPCHYHVEGDWSGASFLLTAGAIAGRVSVQGLCKDSLQGDKVILEVLQKAGARISILSESVIVEKDKLVAFEFDCSDSPDLFTIVAVLAACCKGTSIISGTNRLGNKESSRHTVMARELAKLGIKSELSDNYIRISGSKLKGGAIETESDHRIAMAFSIAALVADSQIEIDNSDCVSKSFPDFFSCLNSISINKQDF